MREDGGGTRKEADQDGIFCRKTRCSCSDARQQTETGRYQRTPARRNVLHQPASVGRPQRRDEERDEHTHEDGQEATGRRGGIGGRIGSGSRTKSGDISRTLLWALSAGVVGNPTIGQAGIREISRNDEGCVV